jgi:endonuclease/exonuclease/phosphatase (EEP) superfamily protein YafD
MAHRAGRLDVRLLSLPAWALAVTWGLGQVLRDATYWSQLAFYVPTPLVAAVMLTVALLWRLRGRTRPAAAFGVAALLPLAFMVAVEHRWTRPAVAAPPADAIRLRVVHWNVRRGRFWDRVVPRAVAAGADLYAFSEPPYGGREREVAAARGFTAPPLRLGELALAARGRLGTPRWLSGGALQAVLVAWEVDGRTWSVLLADLPSNLQFARDPQLQRLRALLERHRPDLVLGDLNAPRRSRALAPLPPGFAHGYEAAGRGWSATWPMPLPIWSIDQCLVGPRLRVTGYRLRGSSASDHRMQIVDLVAGSMIPHAVASAGRGGHLAGGTRHFP